MQAGRQAGRHARLSPTTTRGCTPRAPARSRAALVVVYVVPQVVIVTYDLMREALQQLIEEPDDEQQGGQVELDVCACVRAP